MIWFIFLLIGLFIAAGLAGYFRIIQVIHLNRRRVFGGFIILLVLLTVMTAGSRLDIFTKTFAIRVTMGLYSIAAGFFIGYGLKLIRLRSKAGKLKYMYRSPWIDLAPNLIAVALFAFGIYRTGLLSGGPFTGIGVTSGISLIGFAFLGWCVHIVPEFRLKGILLLDQYIEWKRLVTFEWTAENTLRVEYFTNQKKISEFRTYIPDEDKSIIERILEDKMDEYREERKATVKNDE